MSSGTEDTIAGVALHVIEDGTLYILGRIEDDDIAEDLPTMVLHRKVEGKAKSDTFEILQVYAPGMWMRLGFEA
jgi:hypothetical protein